TRFSRDWSSDVCSRDLSATLLPFKRGAFQMAISAGVPILPLCASNYASRLDLNAWHSVTAKVRGLPAIETQGLTQEDVPALMARSEERRAGYGWRPSRS